MVTIDKWLKDLFSNPLSQAYIAKLPVPCEFSGEDFEEGEFGISPSQSCFTRAGLKRISILENSIEPADKTLRVNPAALGVSVTFFHGSERTNFCDIAYCFYLDEQGAVAHIRKEVFTKPEGSRSETVKIHDYYNDPALTPGNVFQSALIEMGGYISHIMRAESCTKVPGDHPMLERRNDIVRNI